MCLTAGLLQAADQGLSLGPWRQSKPLPPGVWMHAMVAVGDHLYVIGGRTGSGWRSVTANVTYARIGADGALSDWRRTTPLPQAMGGHVALAVGRRLYVVTGSGHGSDTIMKAPATFVADVAPDGRIAAWRPGPPLPAVAAYRGAGAVCNRRLYYVGGFYRRQAYRADIRPDGSPTEWTSEPRLISTRMYLGLVSLAGRPVRHRRATRPAITTSRPTRSSPPKSSQMAPWAPWRRTVPLPAPASRFCTATVDNTVFAVGGGHNQVWCARARPDGELAHWRQDRPLPTPVSLGAAVACRNRLFHAGGQVQRTGAWAVSRRVHVAEVRLPVRYALRFRRWADHRPRAWAGCNCASDTFRRTTPPSSPKPNGRQACDWPRPPWRRSPTGTRRDDGWSDTSTS